MHQFPKFTPAWNSTCFGQFLCPSSGVYSLYTRHWYMSYSFEDSFRAGPGCPSKFGKLVHLFGIIIKKVHGLIRNIIPVVPWCDWGKPWKPGVGVPAILKPVTSQTQARNLLPWGKILYYITRWTATIVFQMLRLSNFCIWHLSANLQSTLKVWQQRVVQPKPTVMHCIVSVGYSPAPHNMFLFQWNEHAFIEIWIWLFSKHILHGKFHPQP